MISTFITQACTDGDALIIIPPFGGVDRPSLGAHILQACAKEKGFKVDVLYCNLLLAKIVGIKQYEYICYAPSTGLIGERFFSKAAYDIDAVSLYPSGGNTGHIRTSRDTQLEGFLEDYKESSKLAEHWVESVVTFILKNKYQVIGCSSTFEQTSAGIALLNKIKEFSNSVITIMGGANCDGEMSVGVKSLSKSIDYIFSGESEKTFPEFLSRIADGELPKDRIIHGEPVQDMSKIPIVNYSDYYDQLRLLSIGEGEVSEIWLPYESSRGCWWGQKNHCLFCGINANGMVFREKSAEQVEMELNVLMENHPTDTICMVDNIMPHSYFKTLLPKLASNKKKYHFFYEQKANLKLDQVELLKEAGVNVIQPGIEALSTPLLKHMKKGVTASQNISLLRYARMNDLFINWNLLHSFPSDSFEWYKNTLEIVKNISHLNPPTGSYALSIDRFSPYFDKSEFHSLSNIRPLYSYHEVFPKEAEISKIAYHFEADYASESRENVELLKEIETEISYWRNSWTENKSEPILHINRLNEDTFLIIDTRYHTSQDKKFTFINKEQAYLCLYGKMLNYNDSDIYWAIDNNYCIAQDEELIPLATTSINTYKLLEAKTKKIPVSVYANNLIELQT